VAPGDRDQFASVDELISHFADYLNSRRLTEFEVALNHVCDCRDLEDLLNVLGVSREEFYQDPPPPAGWAAGGFVSQLFGRTVRLSGFEGVLWPSVTTLGDNLTVYPDNFRPGSVIRPGAFWDPPLLPRL
jgi:hypothetical protein